MFILGLVLGGVGGLVGGAYGHEKVLGVINAIKAKFHKDKKSDKAPKAK